MNYVLFILMFFSACFLGQERYAYAAPAADFFIEIKSFCGNGIAESDEACDGDDLHGTICVAPSKGSLSCNANCTLNVSRCVVPGTPPPSSSGGGGGGGATPSSTVPPMPSTVAPPSAANIHEEPGIIEHILAPFTNSSEEENRARIEDKIALFYSRMAEAEPNMREGVRVENYNAPLRIPPDTYGLLVGDFTKTGESGGKAMSMIAIQVPPGAHPAPLRMTASYTEHDAFEVDEHLTLVGDVFEVLAEDDAGISVHTFYKPLSMSIFLPEGFVGEGNFGVYSQKADDAPWEKVPGAVFTATSVTFTISHLTRFAIFSAPASPDIVSASSVRRIDQSLIMVLVKLLLWILFLALLLLLDKALSEHNKHKHKTIY